MTELLGRKLLPGRTDGAAERRVPLGRLWLIPEKARPSFVPWLDRLPGLRAGENDLTRIAPGRPQADGQLIEISGRVLDECGRPLRNTLVEVWNANRWGRYPHVADPASQPLDPNFLGAGRTITDDEGRYNFRTIRPGSYLARADIGRWRPAHVHFSIRGGSSRLVTQFYFRGDPNLAADPMFSLLGEAQPRHFGTELPPAADGAVRYAWDIVIAGRNACFFSER